MKQHALLILLLTVFILPVTTRAGTLNIDTLGQQTVEAAQKALAPNSVAACLTNVGWASIETQPCNRLFDIFSGQAGISLGRGSLIPVHAAWTDAPWAAFVARPGPKELVMVMVRITARGPVTAGPLNIRVEKGTDFSPFNKVFGKEAFALVSLANGWADKVPFRLLAASRFHGHLCCGVLQVFL